MCPRAKALSIHGATSGTHTGEVGSASVSDPSPSVVLHLHVDRIGLSDVAQAERHAVSKVVSQWWSVVSPHDPPLTIEMLEVD